MARVKKTLQASLQTTEMRKMKIERKKRGGAEEEQVEDRETWPRRLKEERGSKLQRHV